jgi:hypothetical protein
MMKSPFLLKLLLSFDPEGSRHFLNRLAPNKMAMMNSARKMKKRTLAMEAAPSAIPPNPKMAAMMAITKKITDQRNIVYTVKLYIEENYSFSNAAARLPTFCILSNLRTKPAKDEGWQINRINVEAYLRNRDRVIC